jgi:hypothetical protein
VDDADAYRGQLMEQLAKEGKRVVALELPGKQEPKIQVVD